MNKNLKKTLEKFQAKAVREAILIVAQIEQAKIAASLRTELTESGNIRGSGGFVYR